MQRNRDAIEPEVMTHFIRLIFAPARVPYLSSSIPDASNYEKQCMPTGKQAGLKLPYFFVVVHSHSISSGEIARDGIVFDAMTQVNTTSEVFSCKQTPRMPCSKMAGESDPFEQPPPHAGLPHL